MKLGVNESRVSRLMSLSPRAPPTLEIPDLSSMVIHPNFPREISDWEIEQFLQAHRHQAASKRVRLVGEAVGEDDELLVDVIGFNEGNLVPFGTHRDLRLLVDVEEFAQGFSESLIGERVGSRMTATAGPPLNYVGPEISVVYSVHIRSANALEMIHLDAPDWPSQLGLGLDVASTYEKLAIEVNDEWIQRFPLFCVNKILEYLRNSISLEASSDVINYGTFKKWLDTEGRLLQQANISSGERDSSLQVWLDDARTREAVSRSESNSIIFEAIKGQQKMKFDSKKFVLLLEDVRLPMRIIEGRKSWSILSAPFQSVISSLFKKVQFSRV